MKPDGATEAVDAKVIYYRLDCVTEAVKLAPWILAAMSLTALAGMEEKLLIAFRAGQMAWFYAEQIEVRFARRSLDAVHGFPVQRFVFDDATLADLTSLQFELRLDQN